MKLFQNLFQINNFINLADHMEVAILKNLCWVVWFKNWAY